MKNILTLKNIIRIILTLFLVANITVVYYIFQFGYKYVYKSFYLDEFATGEQVKTENINLINFEKAIMAIQKKTGIYSYSLASDDG